MSINNHSSEISSAKFSPTNSENDGSNSTSVKSMAQIIQESLDRRSFLHVTLATACGAVMSPALGQARPIVTGWNPLEPDVKTELFQFTSVPASHRDSVVVPTGYVAEVLYRWGDPINGESPQFLADASNTAEDQAEQAGMGHDGMEYFAIPDHDPNQRGILCVNHEYTDQVLLFADGIEPMPPAKMPLEKVKKSQASHGVSVIEIERQADNTWKVVNSPRTRRLTAATPMQISGPATSIIGEQVLGTLNNCAAGRTPWGTYLTCEENFQGIFGTDSPDFLPDDRQQRYGLEARGYTYRIDDQKVPVYRWWQQESRFDLTAADNDSERFGYVVEIDPMQPEPVPVKRTALGRFRHENAELTLAADGRVVVYMGDDQANEFIYKFVSKHPYDSNQKSDFGVESRGGLLDEGTLYVARFEEDGRGRWLELSPKTSGLEKFSEAEIAVYSRIAASLAGATPMDRPEWLAVNPENGEVFASLTNNRDRTEANAPNPRTPNHFGHILRWHEDDHDAAATTFSWKVFVLAGNAAHADEEMQGNSKGDAFACPDGLKFDASGILWIQTDMSTSAMIKPDFHELGNNMMLAADPATGEIRRFLTGPMGCEITGIALTPDRKTMFINIQHPGEPSDEVSDPLDPSKYSQWPDGPDGGRPRSATIAVRHIDGRSIGS